MFSFVHNPGKVNVCIIPWTVTVLGPTLKRDILAPLDSGAAGLGLKRSVVEFPSLEIFKMQLDRVVDKFI